MGDDVYATKELSSPAALSCSLSLVRKIVLKSGNVGIGEFYFMRSIRCVGGDGAEVFVFGL